MKSKTKKLFFLVANSKACCIFKCLNSSLSQLAGELWSCKVVGKWCKNICPKHDFKVWI